MREREREREGEYRCLNSDFSIITTFLKSEKFERERERERERESLIEH